MSLNDIKFNVINLARKCSPYPLHRHLWMDRDWPLERREVGTDIEYECRHLKAAKDFDGKLHTRQIVQCVLDEETDEVAWYPSEVMPCDCKFNYY